MKRIQIYTILGVVLVLLGMVAVLARDTGFTLKIGSRKFHYELADDSAEREKGLSGRESLPKGQAMLFAFDADSQNCMWMKDMRFGLDMVWLDSNKQVVYMRQNVSPDTYPASFCSDKPARYVIEVNAGAVQGVGLQLGQTVNF